MVVDLAVVRFQAVRAAILVRLWVKTPCPVQVFAPSRLSRWVRSQPYPRLRVLIRPSHPVRHLMVRRNARRFSTCWRAAPGRPLRGITTVRTPSSVNAVRWRPRRNHGQRSRSGCTTGAGFDPLDRRGQLWCVGGVSGMHLVIHDDAVVVVDDLPLVTELEGLPSLPLAIGRASRSCRLTTRVAPSGVVPAIRCRVCPMIRVVTSSRFDRSLMARASRPRRRPAAAPARPLGQRAALTCARRSARRALPSRRCASRAVASARSASSPVIRCTPSLTWSRPS